MAEPVCRGHTASYLLFHGCRYGAEAVTLHRLCAAVFAALVY